MRRQLVALHVIVGYGALSLWECRDVVNSSGDAAARWQAGALDLNHSTVNAEIACVLSCYRPPHIHPLTPLLCR